MNNLDETYGRYSLTPTDDLIRFWRPKVKVTAGCDEDIHVYISSLILMLLLGNFCLILEFLAARCRKRTM